MKNVIEKGKALRISPFVNHFTGDIDKDKETGKFIYSGKVVKEDKKYFITELPKGFDSRKTNKLLNKLMDEGFLSDSIDSTVDNDVRIELVFKRGQSPSIEEIENKLKLKVNFTPNYTLASEEGIVIFKSPEEIVRRFTNKRLTIVKRRIELLRDGAMARISKNNEIIRFIKEKRYADAEKKKDRTEYVGFLGKKKFTHSEYLADMPIYKMTKNEMDKRESLVKEDSVLLKGYNKILKSEKLIKQELINELDDLNTSLNKFIKGDF